MPSLKELGEIITFYSYKGGTGRSMSLANVACIIAKNYRASKTPVLMIDWDLDAPGLHRYFKDRIIYENASSLDEAPGIIDLFYEIKNILLEESFSENNYESLFQKINFKKFVIKTSISNLYLIKAGCFNRSYSDRVRTFDWVALFDENPWLFKCFAMYLSKLYKFVLIDSRTGITDIGGICTMLMPSKLVVVFTPNRQSIDGVIEQSKESVNYRIQSNDPRPLVIFPLPSRIEGSEPGLKELWRNGSQENPISGYQPRFESLLSEIYRLDICSLDDYFENVQIQHVPYYSYGEEIAALDEPTKDRLSLTKSYEYFAWRLVSFDSPWESLKIPSRIPSPPFDFVNRKSEICMIMDSLEKKTNIIGLRGMSGIGKTALALRIAADLENQFPDGQLFIELKGMSANPISSTEALAQIIRAIGSELDSELDLQVDQHELRGIYLSTLARKRVLIILDDAADREQVMPLIPPRECALLITSRNRFTLPGMKAFDLDILPKDDARKFLLMITDRIGDYADELAELCGYHPLALRNIGSKLAEHIDINVSKCAQRLNDDRSRLGLIEASLASSYKILTPDYQRMWCMLSIFPADFNVFGASAVWKMEYEPTAETLSNLVKWSLVDFVHSLDYEDGRYRLHKLVRIFADSYLDPVDRAESQQRHANYYKNILSNAEILYLQGGENAIKGLDLFDRESANIRAGHDWAVKHSIKQADDIGMIDTSLALLLANTYPIVGDQLIDLRLDPIEKIKWLNSAIDAARQLGDRESECIHLNNLGLAHAGIGENQKAIELFKQALDILHESGDHKTEGLALDNLGNAYADLGEYSKSIDFYLHALDKAHKIEDSSFETVILGDLGLAYARIGEAKKAIEFYKKCLFLARKIEDHRMECSALDGMGKAYVLLGEPKKAIEFHQQALKISLEIGDRTGEASNLRSLGLVYKHLGDSRKEIEFYEKALKISREVGDQREEGRDLSRLGSAYKSFGDVRQAIKNFENALEISRKIGDRRCEGINLSNLANAYVDLGYTNKAIEFYMQHLAIVREIGDRIAEGRVLGNLGRAYENLGLQDMYDDWIRKAIESYERHLSIVHETGDQKTEGEILYHLGKTHADLKENLRAIEYYEKALQIEIKSKIGNRDTEVNAIFSPGMAYVVLGDPRKAIEYFEQAIEVVQKMEHPQEEGELLFNVALALDELGQHEEALEYANKALGILVEIKSPLIDKVSSKLNEWNME